MGLAAWIKKFFEAILRLSKVTVQVKIIVIEEKDGEIVMNKEAV